MNWGHKIAIVYIAFVAMILSFVFRAAMQDFSLVRPDYYAAEQSYVAERAAERRTEAREEGAEILYQASLNQLHLQFPTAVQGDIKLYRPSSASLDQTFVLRTDPKGLQEIPLANVPRGRWELILQWEQAGEVFYQRRNLFIQ